MKRVVVQYRCRPDAADANQAAIEDVFAELAQSQPKGLRYAAFRADDGVSFVHVAAIDTDDDSNPLGQSEAFKRFQAGLKERVDVPPTATWMQPIGDYGVLEK